MDALRRALPLLLVVAVAGAACEDGPQASEAEVDEFRAAVDGLCQAASFLGQRQVPEAVRVFQNRTHQYLHQLIARVEPLDRAASSDLLEAKHAMEIALPDPTFYGEKEVGRRLEELHQALLRAGAVVGLPEVGCGA
jgi:hypothetical protein